MPEFQNRARIQFGAAKPIQLQHWDSVELQRSVEALSGSWTVKGPRRLAEGRELYEHVRIYLGDDLLMIGHLEAITEETTEGQTSATLSGRDGSGQLVDVSARQEPGQWFDADFRELADAVTYGTGVVVTVDPGLPLTTRFPEFSLQSEETAGSALERLCRLRGLLAYPGKVGDVIVTRPGGAGGSEPVLLGTSGPTLQMGGSGNVRRLRRVRNGVERFSRYKVHGSRRGSDEASGDAVATIEAVAEDPAVPIIRTLVVRPEGQVTQEDADARAAWEATWRAARSEVVEVEVLGWRHGGMSGPLLKVNELAFLVAPHAGILPSRTLLVAGVTYSQSSAGTSTTLKLVRPDAYTPAPVVDQTQGVSLGA